MRQVIKKILLLRLQSPKIVHNYHPRNIRPPYTLKYIQSLINTENKYEVRMIDCLINCFSNKQLIKYIIKWHPDLIVISTITTDIDYFISFIRTLKDNLDVILIGVGQNVIALHKNYYTDNLFDFLLQGEPEIEVFNIIKQINNGINLNELKDRYIEKKFYTVLDLNKLSFPFYSKDEFKRYGFIYPVPLAKRLLWGHILSSRGCPYNCIFCTQVIRDSFGSDFRTRDTRNVIDEIEIQKMLGCNIISFDDDNFTISAKYVIDVCNELIRRKINIKWIAHARVDNLDRELLKLMQRAGCTLLRFGIESGSERIIRNLNKTLSSDWIEKCRRIFQYCKELRISTTGLFMIGCPYETKEDIWKSINLALDLEPDIIQVSFFTPYPDSKIFEHIKKEIKVKKEDLANLYHYSPSPINLSNLSNKKLQFYHQIFYRKFLFRPKFVIRHIIKYFPFYLLNIDKIFKLLKPWRYLMFRRIDYVKSYS